MVRFRLKWQISDIFLTVNNFWEDYISTRKIQQDATQIRHLRMCLIVILI